MNIFCFYCVSMHKEDKIPSKIIEIHGSYKNIVLQMISIINHDSIKYYATGRNITYIT